MKNILLSAAALLGLANLSMSAEYDYMLLTVEDQELAELERTSGPVMWAPENSGPYWESYNEWMCFSADDLIDMQCSEHEMEKVVSTPFLSVIRDGVIFDFEVSVTQEVDCEDTLKEWAQLLGSEGPFCVHAAYLQNISSHPNHTLWILSRLKTAKGYWVESKF